MVGCIAVSDYVWQGYLCYPSGAAEGRFGLACYAVEHGGHRELHEGDVGAELVVEARCRNHLPRPGRFDRVRKLGSDP
jgi:hypothetical protein